jgi:small subunit ribosomal protein S1
MEEKQLNDEEITEGEEQQLDEVGISEEEEQIVEAEPIVQEAEPVAQEPEHVAEEPEPSKAEAEPTAEEPEPVAEEAEPTVEEAKPVAEEPEPTKEELAQEERVEEQTEEHPMTALMAEDALAFERLRPGQIKEGEIVSVTPTEVLIDVGAKSEGLVPSKELERLGREGLDNLQVGQKIAVYVVRPEDRDGNLILSIRRAEEEDDWRRAKELHETGEHIETPVAGFNKGGLIVRLGKLRGFVPASQLMAQHRGSDAQQPEERWSRLVGTSVHVKIIEINRKRKRLILSERAALRLVREAQKAELLKNLRPGEVRKGVVSSLTDFGAFVNLGGADGLVHLSELSWNRAAKPRELLKVGQEVEVYVLNVDQEKRRIALSLKRLEPEPWATAESRYYVGQLVEGTVTRLANFGAFALVNDELEGLIHISELSIGRINHPQEVVQEGEKHVMRIIRIDAQRRRMGLSLKRVADPEYADLDWQAELAEAESAYEPVEAEPDEDQNDEEM